MQFSETTRIIREAVSNALKHSETPLLSVTLHGDTDKLNIIIANSGLDPSATPGPQRGLNIMQFRASKIGGGFEFGIADQHWQVLLSVPVNR